MIRIAISGHRNLAYDTVRLVDAAIRATLAEHVPDIIGVSCLADGADQIFARAVVDLGGALEAVIPAERYREGLPTEAYDEYDALIGQAIQVHRLAFVESTSESHMVASRFMLERVDELYAVWDGKPARGYGGTADVVAAAHAQGLAVRYLWPGGARRD